MANYTTSDVIPFKATASYPDADFNGPYTYRWTFADGATATGQYTTHQYTTIGVKTTQVSVTNESTSEVVVATITDTIS